MIYSLGRKAITHMGEMWITAFLDFSPRAKPLHPNFPTVTAITLSDLKPLRLGVFAALKIIGPFSEIANSGNVPVVCRCLA